MQKNELEPKKNISEETTSYDKMLKNQALLKISILDVENEINDLESHKVLNKFYTDFLQLEEYEKQEQKEYFNAFKESKINELEYILEKKYKQEMNLVILSILKDDIKVNYTKQQKDFDEMVFKIEDKCKLFEEENKTDEKLEQDIQVLTKECQAFEHESINLDAGIDKINTAYKNMPFLNEYLLLKKEVDGQSDQKEMLLKNQESVKTMSEEELDILRKSKKDFFKMIQS